MSKSELQSKLDYARRVAHGRDPSESGIQNPRVRIPGVVNSRMSPVCVLERVSLAPETIACDVSSTVPLIEPKVCAAPGIIRIVRIGQMVNSLLQSASPGRKPFEFIFIPLSQLPGSLLPAALSFAAVFGLFWPNSSQSRPATRPISLSSRTSGGVEVLSPATVISVAASTTLQHRACHDRAVEILDYTLNVACARRPQDGGAGPHQKCDIQQMPQMVESHGASLH